MTTRLIPREQLCVKRGDMRRLLAPIESARTAEMDDQSYGEPMTYYVLFEHHDLLPQVGLPPLSEEDLFYNKYYWFRAFVKRHRAAAGYDAGLEQQAFKMLENARSPLDWSVIERISALADAETTERTEGR